MFDDSLLESGGRLKTRRGAATLLSFVLQVVFVGFLMTIPPVYTEGLPKQQLMTFLVAPSPPPPPPARAAAPIKVVKQMQSDLIGGRLRSPSKIPEKVQVIQEEGPPPVMWPGALEGGIPGGGQPGGAIKSIISWPPLPVRKVVIPQRIRVSRGVSQGLLIKKVSPSYPPLARQARIQGQVVLQAEISKDGSIEKLRLVSGPPMLAPAGIEAVRQWRYKPYLLNGEPVAVETTVVVNFTLSGG